MLVARSVHPLPGEAERKERFLSLVDGFSSRRVLVVGDLIADEFIYGEIARVSREAPVLILKHRSRSVAPGGGANAICNLADLGVSVLPVGVVGDDDNGRALLHEFRRRRIAVQEERVAPREVEVRQRECNEGAIGVLRQTPIAHLRETPQPFDHGEHMFDAGANLRLVAVLATHHFVDAVLAARALIREVAGF